MFTGPWADGPPLRALPPTFPALRLASTTAAYESGEGAQPNAFICLMMSDTLACGQEDERTNGGPKKRCR